MDFFINVEFILSVKKWKKVIFEKTKIKKFAKKADYPLNPFSPASITLFFKSMGSKIPTNFYCRNGL